MDSRNPGRELRVLKGLCRQCGKAPATSSRIHCEECLKLARHRRAIWQRKNYQKNKARKKQIRDHQRREVLLKYGGKCACCDESELGFLSIDHVHGNGREHRRQLGLRDLYPWLHKNPVIKGLQVLCMNCNCAKSWYGKCPHEDPSVVRFKNKKTS